MAMESNSNQDELKDEQSFLAYRGKNNAESAQYFFLTDENGKPEKVGDGTYGAVFGVTNFEGEQYVVKIFYETLTTPRLSPLKLTGEDLTRIRNRIRKPDNSIDDNKTAATSIITDDSLETNGDYENNSETGDATYGSLQSTMKKLQALKERQGEISFGSIGQLASELQELGLPQDHLRCVFDHFQSSSSSFEQFTKEMTASARMRRALGNERLIGVVNIEGSTTDFKDNSIAFRTFQKGFSEMQIDVSNYALVMKRYEYTLKDILESPMGNKPRIREENKGRAQKRSEMSVELSTEGVEDSEEPRQAIESEDLNEDEKASSESLINRPNGYKVLRALTFEERVRTILPFLIQIAHGVRTIHKARQYHFDLKPTNIFVNDDLGTPVVVVGDLGSIQFEEVSASTSSLDVSAHMQDTLRLGTRHYRSPEQKDYFDICYVRVMHRKSGATEDEHRADQVVLQVTDRKFKDTIIETGDQVVFSKASDPSARYTIEAIRLLNTDDAICEIIISPQYRAEMIQEDDKTQVILYKKQGARTDLFGLGAIAYDLITCGLSPERFYDSIRIFDKKEGSVQNLLEKYTQLTQMHGSTNPTIRSIFAPFFQNRRSVDPAFVEFILRCMLYQAKGTYYNQDGDLDSSKNFEKDGEYYVAVDAALESLNKLAAKFKPDPKNKLLDTEASYREPPDSTYFFEELNRLQDLSAPSDFPVRLAQGAALFKKVFDLASKGMDNLDRNESGTEVASGINGSGTLYFAEMVPQNIERLTEKELKFKSETYGSYREYIEDLKSDHPFFRINSDIQNPYVPLHFIAARRRLKLEKADGEFRRYNFVDSSPSGSSVSKNDWIVDSNKKMLWRVTSVHDSIPNQITLKLVNDEHANPLEDPGTPIPGDAGSGEEEYIYYQNLDPARYYLNMLGIYLHQIFFANIGRTSRDRPEAIDIARKVVSVCGSDKVKVLYQEAKFSHNFDGVVSLITQMYLRLTLYGHIEPPSAQSVRNCFEAVRDERDKLLKTIGEFLGTHHDDLHKIKGTDYDSRWLEKNVPDGKVSNFDFNELILDFVRKNNFTRDRLL